MNNFLEQRIIKEADYILKNKATIRRCAKAFGVSKSTVHLDLSKKLRTIDCDKYNKVKALLAFNFCVKHLRGGQTIREKSKKRALY